jgi:hypothetical protein
MWGVSLLRSKPVLAGVSFGLGAALKPQCLFLAPVALISGRHWKALAGMALAWLMFAIATLSFWTDWLHLVPTLPKFLARYYSYLAGYGATPKYFAEFLGLPTLPFQAAGICFGILIVWAAFRSEDSVTRVVALVSGALIASPYALRYELAALAPALVASFMTNTLRGAIVAVPLLCMRVSIIVPALVISSLMALVPSRIGSKLGLPPPVSSGREGQAGA